MTFKSILAVAMFAAVAAPAFAQDAMSPKDAMAPADSMMAAPMKPQAMAMTATDKATMAKCHKLKPAAAAKNAKCAKLKASMSHM